MASCVVVSDSLGRKTIHISTLRHKSSSKATESIGSLLTIGSAGLMFVDGGVDRCQWRQALRDGINLWNRVLGTESLSVKGQGVGVSTFREGSKRFLVDVNNCLGAKNLRRAFGRSYQQKRFGHDDERLNFKEDLNFPWE